MRKAISICLLITLAALATFLATPVEATLKKSKHSTASLRDGDLIFQQSVSDLSTAIQMATHSKYSHCGILYKNEKGWQVFEAVQPVCLTPLEDWIARGANKHYVIKRLKNTGVLTPEALKKMKAYGETLQGRDYDIYFNWGDERIYCSELIWKIYRHGTGLEIGKLQKLREFDLSSKLVQQKLREHYGNAVPLDEPVISPVSVFNSDLLETVSKYVTRYSLLVSCEWVI